MASVEPTNWMMKGQVVISCNCDYGCVGAHGGNVKVKETSGGGATFEVELPLASPPD